MLREQIMASLKDAMKSREEKKVSTLRLINAAIKDRDIAARGKGDEDGLKDEEILQLLQSMVKQRLDSIEMYKKGGRQDLVDNETKEIDIIKDFLPKQLDEDEVVSAISSTIMEVDAKSIKDMGKVMAELRHKYAGQMDFAKASGLIKEKLSA
ncbi:MAG: GatB/YqeY domain-containing protein [Alphaproteobacteria bacterium]